jgi:parallel beta-helix repeat protein
MHVNNLTLDGLNATNFYTAIRGLIVNDSVFTNISLDGGQISSINFAGGTSSRNNISFVNITNVKANAAISLGGANNTASDFYIHDSNTTGSSIGFASATTTSGNTYQRFLVQNMTKGISFTNIGSGNIIKDIQLVNVSEAYLVNSTASGTKTITLQNITISEAGGTPPRMFFDLFDTVSPSEQYLIHLPGDFTPSSMIDNRSIFRYHVLNYTIYAGSPSIDNFNFTWFDSELYNGNNEATLESYYYNATSGAWQLQNNTPDTTNNKLGQNPLNISGIYGLFDYVNCPVITVAEPFEQWQNYSGAPNFLGGQFSCIYVNVSNAQIECADNSINGDGSGGLGIFIATSVSNTTISNCNINTYFYGIFNQNGQNNSISQSTITNSIASGIYLDSSNNNFITSNDFIGNGQAIDLVYADQHNTISGNQIINSSTRGIAVSVTSNLNNITLNSFQGNNIDMTFLSSTANNIIENSFSGASFVSLQIVGATSNFFDRNLIGGAFTAIDISSGAVSNLFSNNNLTSNTAGIIIDSSNNNAFQANRVSGSTYAFRTTNSNVTLQGDTFYANTADVEVISNMATHSINASNLLLLPFDGSLTNYSNLSVYDVQLNAEDYQINYGSDIPYEDTTHIKFNNKRVTFNDITSNMDLDSLTYYYLLSELNMSEDTLQMYSWNGSALNNLGATQGGNALTKINLNGVNQVGLYYAPFAITSCRTLNQSGDYQLEADVSAIASCLIFNNNSINLNCAGSTISGPGNNTPGAYGITSTGFNNSLVDECTFIDFDRDISVSGGNNFTVNKSSFSNSNNGVLYSNQNGSSVDGSYFTNVDAFRNLG